MANPTVSIILPTYNRAHTFEHAVKSLLRQTYQDFEIIIVDDGSSDNTESLIKEMMRIDKRIRYLKHDRNRGAAAAKNTGIKHASGRYIAFQDSDDEWISDKLEKQIITFKNAPEDVGVVYTGFWRIFPTRKVYTPYKSVRKKEGDIYYELLNHNFVGMPTVLIKRECFEKVGLFDELLPPLEDWELFLRISKYFSFSLIDEPLVIEYESSDSISKVKSAKITALRRMIEKHQQDFIRYSKKISKFYFQIGDYLCRYGESKEARSYLKKAFCLKPTQSKYLIAYLLSLLGKSIYSKVYKNVLFIIRDYENASSRVRVLNLLPELKQRNIEFEVIQYKNLIDKIRIFMNLKRFDIIFLQRKLPSILESFFLKIFSKKLIFDFDDAIYIKPYSRDINNRSKRYIRFRRIVKMVDCVIAGNRFLAEEARKFNKNVVVIPSAVETRNIPLKDWRVKNDYVVIGWIGSIGNLPCLKIIEPVLEKLSKEYPVELAIICSETLNMTGVKVRFIPWTLETQEEEIAKFDIGVMPLPKTKWTKGKCGYKALQYMAAGVPPVVSYVGINSEIVEHGKEGFVAKDLDEFYKYLKILIENRELRKEMGLKARQKVEKYYSITVVSEMLVDVLTSL
ncbi:MAG TPA: glycosyltransferase [bacterium]|nr:glycosyltransferase [bacterium]